MKTDTSVQLEVQEDMEEQDVPRLEDIVGNGKSRPVQEEETFASLFSSIANSAKSIGTGSEGSAYASAILLGFSSAMSLCSRMLIMGRNPKMKRVIMEMHSKGTLVNSITSNLDMFNETFMAGIREFDNP